MKNYKKTILILLTLLLLLALGIVMVLAMKMMVSMETGTVIIALLIPLLAYLLLSGTVEELGFGGVKAKFTLTANTGVTLSDVGNMKPKAHDFDEVGNRGAAAVEGMLNHYNFNDGTPIFLSFILGRNDYDRGEAAAFIKHLAAYRSFKLIVFLGRLGCVEGFMSYWAAQKLLNDDEKGKIFIDYINANNVEGLDNCPGVVKELLTPQSTNAEALRLMNEKHLDALVVVESDHSLKGVVERDEVVSRMMQMLVDKSTIGA
jgi:hypothetical protein